MPACLAAANGRCPSKRLDWTRAGGLPRSSVNDPPCLSLPGTPPPLTPCNDHVISLPGSGRRGCSARACSSWRRLSALKGHVSGSHQSRRSHGCKTELLTLSCQLKHASLHGSPADEPCALRPLVEAAGVSPTSQRNAWSLSSTEPCMAGANLFL